MTDVQKVEMSTENVHTVFVYGSLKRGFGNHRLLENEGVKFLGEAETPARFKMLHLGGFPGVVPGDQSIKGEVYEVNDEVFQSLDWLEGFPSFYNRSQIEVQEGTLAWMYHLNTPAEYYDCEVIESGEW